ncbi:MOSC domain-containing protein [Streptomyces sp. NPDC046759]|uniref:MOSC domain-containing protein n=1 Tax=Streptomyces sp. NPDC046759 TaxID=3155019 RepID=UPI0033C20729
MTSLDLLVFHATGCGRRTAPGRGFCGESSPWPTAGEIDCDVLAHRSLEGPCPGLPHGPAAERRRRRSRRSGRARRRNASRPRLPLQSYRYWQKQLGRDDLTFGIFGENFTVDGLPDDEVCTGDRYRICEAEFEVSQPRVTCYRVGMRLGEPAMASLLVAHHRPGFYLRVITEAASRPVTPSPSPARDRNNSASPTPTRCSTSRTEPREGAQSTEHPRPQSRMAAVLPRTRRARAACREAGTA